MAECNHDCSSCSEGCEKKDFMAACNKDSNIKKVIGVISGKGGVGKSLVTSLLAVALSKKGYKVGILDADITGPSIPQGFGINASKATGQEGAINPSVTDSGIKVCSMNFFVEDASEPVIWRGPVIAGAVKQFYSDVVWGDLDFMFVDMPPGTGDVPLTVFQSLPVDAVVIVSSPQKLVNSIVEKAIKMANTMQINILGLVENMSFVECPQCKQKIYIYGKSALDQIAHAYNLPILAHLAIQQDISNAIDTGSIENLDTQDLEQATSLIQDMLKQNTSDNNSTSNKGK